jgi:hypothetical protein
MLTWTGPQRDTIESPTFSLSGVVLSWPDGAPALLNQTAFIWQGDAWQACVELSSAGREPRKAYGVIRLEPAVVAAWETRRLNPRREAANQLRSIIPDRADQRDLGTVTFVAV